MDKQSTDPQKNATLSSFGARRALNFVTDIARGRKTAVTFILDHSNGNIIETHTGREIEVEFRERRN